MGWTLVAHTIKQVASGGATDAIDTTGANLIVVTISNSASGSPVTANFSDSASNTWSTLTGRGTGGQRVRGFYCLNPTTSATHTFNYTEASSASTVTVQAWSGAATSSPLDVQSAGGTGSGTSLSAGTATATADGYLYITGIVWVSTIVSPSIDNSFTISDSAPTVGTSVAGGMGYKVQTTAASLTPTWSWTNSVGVAAYCAVFKVAAAGGVAKIVGPGGIVGPSLILGYGAIVR